MAKVRNNIVMKGLSGSLGDQLVLKQDKFGRTIVAVKPTYSENHVFSDAQKAQQDRFRMAIQYGRSAKTLPVYAEQAARTKLSTYNLAMADWFNAPEVVSVDASAWSGQAGETIRVQAMDDTKVAGVSVSIQNGSGAELEHGDAVEGTDGWWTYTTQMAGAGTKIVARAVDLPGHAAELVWED